MILHLGAQLRLLNVVLASGSPRRREILGSLGFKFQVKPSSFAENLDKASFASPADYVAETCRRKAEDVANELADSKDVVDLIISADTIVVKDNAILEKPADADVAKQMLLKLNNSPHVVLTAVTLVLPKSKVVRTFVEETTVLFGDLSEAEMDAYIATGEPFDKAGGYGIQGLASPFIKGVDGCYFNVVGFPVHRFSAEISQLVSEGSLVLPAVA